MTSKTKGAVVGFSKLATLALRQCQQLALLHQLIDQQ